MRDNDRWITELSHEEPAAIADLRTQLLRNLRKAFANKPQADESFLDDAVQESVLHILDRLDRFAGRSQFVTWATSIAIRHALSDLRRRRWRDVSLDELLADPQAAKDRTTVHPPSAAYEHVELLAAMHRAIEEDLTQKQRAALVAELKGMPQDEIAAHLGSNRNAIYKLTHDARKKLRARLESLGYSVHDLSPQTR